MEHDAAARMRNVEALRTRAHEAFLSALDRQRSLLKALGMGVTREVSRIAIDRILRFTMTSKRLRHSPRAAERRLTLDGAGLHRRLRHAAVIVLKPKDAPATCCERASNRRCRASPADQRNSQRRALAFSAAC